MSGQPKKLRMEEGKADTATRSPPKKSRTTQTIPKKKKLKSEAEKVKEKAAKLRLGKAEITPEEVSRMTKAQKRELYAAAAARSAAHREVEQYEDDNVGAQALNEGEKTAEGAGHYTRSRYARRLKKKAKLQAGKKKTRTEKTAASDESKRTSTAEGEVHWFRAGSSGRKFAKATMLQLSQAVWLRRRRQQQSCIRQCIGSPVRRRAGDGQRQVGSQCRSQWYCKLCKGQRTRACGRGRFSFAHAAGHVGVFILFYFVFRHYACFRADHLHRRGPGHPGRRAGL